MNVLPYLQAAAGVGLVIYAVVVLAQRVRAAQPARERAPVQLGAAEHRAVDGVVRHVGRAVDERLA